MKTSALTFHDEHAFDFFGSAIQSYQFPFQKQYSVNRYRLQQPFHLHLQFCLQDPTVCKFLGPAKTLRGGDLSREQRDQTRSTARFHILKLLFFRTCVNYMLFQHLFFRRIEEVPQYGSQYNQH